jgi:hypothetical protein
MQSDSLSEAFGYDAAVVKSRDAVLWAFDTECVRIGVDPPVWTPELSAWAEGYRVMGNLGGTIHLAAYHVSVVGGLVSAALERHAKAVIEWAGSGVLHAEIIERGGNGNGIANDHWMAGRSGCVSSLPGGAIR